MSISQFIDFPNLSDKRGSLVSIDSSVGLPFDVKRIYYIFGTQKNVSRGHHAHKRLHQAALCISGSCEMTIDNGDSQEKILINSPYKAINLPPMLWHEMYNFSQDCILLVLASDFYNEDDYIRDYKNFKKLLNQ